jgi:hypothetical protein
VSDTASSDLLNFEMLEDMKRNCSIENDNSKYEGISENIEEIKWILKSISLMKSGYKVLNSSNLEHYFN